MVTYFLCRCLGRDGCAGARRGRSQCWRGWSATLFGGVIPSPGSRGWPNWPDLVSPASLKGQPKGRCRSPQPGDASRPIPRKTTAARFATGAGPSDHVIRRCGGGKLPGQSSGELSCWRRYRPWTVEPRSPQPRQARRQGPSRPGQGGRRGSGRGRWRGCLIAGCVWHRQTSQWELASWAWLSQVLSQVLSQPIWHNCSRDSPPALGPDPGYRNCDVWARSPSPASTIPMARRRAQPRSNQK